MSLEFNTENRNGFIGVRCCSYCRRPGHNITTCNSPRLDNFEMLCIRYIHEGNNFISFRNFLLQEAINDPNLIKAFAIRKCNASTRNNIDRCITLIINYFETSYGIDQNDNLIQEFPTVSLPQSQPPSLDISNENYRNIYNNLPMNRRDYDILMGYMFIDMIMSIHESSESILKNVKFDIKTKISEIQDKFNVKCECNICYEEYEKKQFIKLGCSHEFCKDCIKKSLQNEIGHSPCCALCRLEMKNFELRDLSILNEFNELLIMETRENNISFEEVN